MDINKKREGNNPNITIPKSDLKTQAESKNNCIDTPLRGTIDEDKILQYNTIKNMITNINFKQIITEILDREKSRQNAQINPTQNPATRNKTIGQASTNAYQNTNLGPETNNHNNKKEGLESQLIETDIIFQETLVQKTIQDINLPTIEESHQLPKEENNIQQHNFSILSKAPPTTSQGEKIIHKIKEKALFIHNTQEINPPKLKEIHYPMKQHNDREKENDITLNDEHFTAYQLSSKLTPFQENEMQAKNDTMILHQHEIHRQAYSNQQVQSERKDAHMNVIHKIAFPENSFPENSLPKTTIPENDFHEETNYLTPIEQINKVDDIINTKNCVSTQYNLINLPQNDDKKPNPFKTPHFNNMEDIQRQGDNLQDTKTQQKTLISGARAQQTQAIMAMKSKRKNIPQYMASLATIGRKPTFFCRACNYTTKHKYHFDRHHSDKSHNESLQTSNTKQEITNEIITNDNNLGLIPIQWNLTELSNSDQYESAIIRIHQRIPIQYRHNLIALLGTIYQSGTDYEIKIKIKDGFQDRGHWILSKYNKLLKYKNTRQHLQNKLEKGEYDLVSKTISQENEIKQIAGAGRIIYDIFIHCQFIPIEYLCLLATILNTGTSYQYICSSIILPDIYSTYGEYIDLMLNVGAFYIATEEITNNTILDNIVDSYSEKKFPQTIHINPDHNHQTECMNGKTSEEDIIIDNIEEKGNKQTHLNKDDFLMQVTLQHSFDTLKTENVNTEKFIDNKIMDWNTQTTQGETIKTLSTPYELHKNNNNTDICVEFVEGTRYGVVRRIFSQYGDIKHMVTLSSATAIIRFHHPESAKAVFSNLNAILENNILVGVTPRTGQTHEFSNNNIDITLKDKIYNNNRYIELNNDTIGEKEQELMGNQETNAEPFENSHDTSYSTSIYSIPSLTSSPTSLATSWTLQEYNPNECQQLKPNEVHNYFESDLYEIKENNPTGKRQIILATCIKCIGGSYLCKIRTSKEEEPSKICCICQKTNKDWFLINCDTCSEWFHGKCVGVDKKRANYLKHNTFHEWTCPKCPCSGIPCLYNTFNDIIEHKIKVFAKKSSKGFILQIEVGDNKGTPLFTLTGLNKYDHHKILYLGDKIEFICCLPNQDNFMVKCGIPSKNVEELITHQRTSHNITYSPEFFEQDQTISNDTLNTLIHKEKSQKNQQIEPQFQNILESSNEFPFYEKKHRGTICSPTSASNSIQELQFSLSNSPTTLKQNERLTPSKEHINKTILEDKLHKSPTTANSFIELESITAHSTVQTKELSLNKRLEAYKNNAWELMIMQDRAIPPGKLNYISIKITAHNNPNITPLHSQNDFVLISALYPQPQINDGIYYTNHKLDQVVIKNSSKYYLYLRKGEILKGVKAHTYEFVIQSLLNNYNNRDNMHTNNWTKWHQEAKLFQKILTQ